MAEIAAASNEQAHGIEQANRAVSEMDKVVQQVAASAEESASASEEMNAQAGQMKDVIDELKLIVSGGSGKDEKRVRSEMNGAGPGDLAKNGILAKNVTIKSHQTAALE